MLGEAPSKPPPNQVKSTGMGILEVNVKVLRRIQRWKGCGPLWFPQNSSHTINGDCASISYAVPALLILATFGAWTPLALRSEPSVKDTDLYPLQICSA